MRVLFAPDWRAGVPYQRLLAEALAEEGVETLFPEGYRRLLPLARTCRELRPDLLHLHWPEAYYAPRRDALSGLRLARHPLDLRLAGCPALLTAHNLFAHNTEARGGVRRAALASFRSARAVIAHSAAAAEEISRATGIGREKIRVIPHGDVSVPLGPPEERRAARMRLGIGEEPLALMFGTIEPYKGIGEMIRLWRAARPRAALRIVGRPCSAGYAAELAGLIDPAAGIGWEPRWIDDAELRLWLSAADVALFNYTRILTSGAAALARAYGLPLLLPDRLRSLDLGEPDPSVFRFGPGDFAAQLDRALGAGSGYDRAGGFREATAWRGIAAATASLYRDILRGEFSSGPRGGL